MSGMLKKWTPILSLVSSFSCGYVSDLIWILRYLFRVLNFSHFDIMALLLPYRIQQYWKHGKEKLFEFYGATWRSWYKSEGEKPGRRRLSRKGWRKEIKRVRKKRRGETNKQKKKRKMERNKDRTKERKREREREKERKETHGVLCEYSILVRLKRLPLSIMHEPKPKP